MDILDQHLEQQDVSIVSPKEEVGTGIVIEETDIVDCDGYDPLAGDHQIDDDGLRYQETLSYRVVSVNGNSSSSEIELPVTHQSGNAVQVLTTPINGQFYVIGNANEVFTSQSSRSLAPRATTIETPRSMSSNVKKRDDRRRATHNEVERRRRDKINNWITKLGKIIPECTATTTTTTTNGNSSSGEGKINYETQSKGGILAKACDYINELEAANQNLTQRLRDNENLRDEIERLKDQVNKLSQENAALRS